MVLMPAKLGADLLLLWGSIKWAVIVAVLVLSHAFMYFNGKSSCEEASYKALDKELTKEQKRGAEAIKIAVRDQKELSNARSRSDELIAEANSLSSPVGCNISDEQLRVLSEIQAESNSQ